MINHEEQLSKALTLLRQGSSLDEVSKAYPDISELLSTVQLLKSIPLNPAPRGLMQRRYSRSTVQTSVWSTLFHFSRFATLSLSFTFIAAALATTAFASLRSLPGQKLYSIKKGTEKIQLSLVSDPVEKASLYVTLSEKRLKEAEQILSSNHSSSQKIAAINELSNQTQQAVQQVQKAAESRPLMGEKDTELVSALENVAKKQQDLLTTLHSEGDTKAIAQDALAAGKETEVKVAEIKKNMTVAAAEREQSLTTLSSDPSIVQVSGSVLKLEKNKITVEGVEFSITDKTVMKDIQNKKLTLKEFTTRSKVSVVGKKEGDTLNAQEILLVGETKEEGDVKGTTSPASTLGTGKATSTPKKLVEPEPIAEPEMEPGTTVGTFILEDPAPQFQP